MIKKNTYNGVFVHDRHDLKNYSVSIVVHDHQNKEIVIVYASITCQYFAIKHFLNSKPFYFSFAFLGYYLVFDSDGSDTF